MHKMHKFTPECLESLHLKSVESVSEDQVTQEQMELSDDNSRTIEVKDTTEEDLDVRLGYVKMGSNNKLEVPEAKTLLEVIGQIDERLQRYYWIQDAVPMSCQQSLQHNMVLKKYQYDQDLLILL